MTNEPYYPVVIVEADGGSRGNPGRAGYGAVVCDAATGEVLTQRCEAIGVATNNVAEYSGLVAGLAAAVELGARHVEVRMDSRLVIEQMAGRWQIRNAGLRPLAAKAAELLSRFDTVHLTWVPREHNQRADALANVAMDRPPAELLAPVADGPHRSPEGHPAAADQPAATIVADGTAAGVVGPRSWLPPSAGPTTRLMLVRHGETALTAQRRYSGRRDVALSEQGHRQAVAVAVRVATMAGSVAAVVSSPLVRCMATAERIAVRTGVGQVQTMPELVECDFGSWEGLTFVEVRERWPDQLDQWLSSPAAAPPGGESFDQVYSRVRAVVPALLSDHPGRTVVAVSHVTPIKLILRDALDGGGSFLQRLFLDPAGISIVDMWPGGGAAVRSVNDTAHLVHTRTDPVRS